MILNQQAFALADRIASDAESLQLEVRTVGGTRIIDCGIETHGSLEAGRRLAEVCLSGLGEVHLADMLLPVPGPAVRVQTSHPLAACLASQYAGWQITGPDGYFAMASGPMRAVAARELLFDQQPLCSLVEHSEVCVGVLEASRLPTPAVCEQIARKCNISPSGLTLLVAPTNSLAGGVQVVARSVETALHKLHEVGFDLTKITAGSGIAPLPPVASNPRAAIGRTNDAVLYGANVELHVANSDAQIAEFGPQTPSNASAAHGRPFAEIFAAHGNDFYAIDPLLFSPAVVTFVNEQGQQRSFGNFAPDVLAKSFGET